MLTGTCPRDTFEVEVVTTVLGILKIATRQAWKMASYAYIATEPTEHRNHHTADVCACYFPDLGHHNMTSDGMMDVRFICTQYHGISSKTKQKCVVSS